MVSKKPTVAWAEPAPAHGTIMVKVDALESAKRRAAASFTHMVSCASDPQQYALATKATTRDEQDVLRARVDVLNTLMRNPEAKLCLPAEDRKPRVCVTYERLRCEGELELGPMQSTMAWAVRGAEDPALQLMSAADNAGHAPVVKSLLQLVLQSAPKKDILQGLHTVLALPPPDRLVLKSLAGISAQHTGHTKVFEGLGETQTGPVPPLYRVVWGALDLDVLEGWQNPSTNTAIRLSILDTAHQAAREAQQTKAPIWSNVAHLQVRIFHGEECHVLSLHPFWDSESCTVSHLQYRQSVFDDSGPERGILNLSQDPGSIHPIPLGKILPIQAFVCLGAHRKSRLSESQLNFVHAQGLLAHGLNPEHLPDAGTLLAVSGKMCPAKATRVSGDKLDIMASSYHVADQVYTTISVVQYPPFGTQFEGGRKSKRAQGAGVLAVPRTWLGPDKWGDEASEDEEPSGNSDLDPSAPTFVVSEWNRGNRPAPGPDRTSLEYLADRPAHDGPCIGKGWTWNEPLCLNEHFFIDGIGGSPYDKSFRFILFEMDNGLRYKQVQQELKKIKAALYKEFAGTDEWDTSLSFYTNIDENQNIHDVWNVQWRKFLRDNYAEVLEDVDSKGTSLSFWYANNPRSWSLLFYKPEEKVIAQKYIQHQKALMEYWRANKHLNVRMGDRLPRSLACTRRPKNNTPLANDQLPLPQTLLSARSRSGSDPAVAQLQSRISALESRLSRVRQEENTQHLLEQVLERLDTPHVD